jgi:hypothetical protein
MSGRCHAAEEAPTDFQGKRGAVRIISRSSWQLDNHEDVPFSDMENIASCPRRERTQPGSPRSAAPDTSSRGPLTPILLSARQPFFSFPQHALYYFGQFRAGQEFGDTSGNAEFKCPTPRYGIESAGNYDDRDLWLGHAKDFDEFEAVHRAGPSEIGEKQIRLKLPGQPQRLFIRSGFENPRAGGDFQEHSNHQADGRIVIQHQDYGTFGGRNRGPFRRSSVELIVKSSQVIFHRSCLGVLTLDRFSIQ